MGQQTFNLRTFADLDGGKMDILVAKLLKQAVTDVRDRPLESKARELTLKIAIAPGEADTDGGFISLEDFKVKFGATLKVPGFSSTDYTMAADKENRLLFNSLAPENPNQRTIDDELNRKEDD